MSLSKSTDDDSIMSHVKKHVQVASYTKKINSISLGSCSFELRYFTQPCMYTEMNPALQMVALISRPETQK